MEQEDVGGNHKENEEEPLLDIDIDDESDQQNNEGPQGMGHLQDLTNDDLEIDSYKIDSIPHTTAEEERALWRRYIKWRHIKRILGSKSVLNDICEASPIVMSRIIDNMPEASPIIMSRIIDNMPEVSPTVISRIIDNMHNMPEASYIIISRIIKEISSSHDLIVLLRRHSGLDELGDTIIEDDEDNVKYMTEVARLIFKHSEKKHDEKIKQGNSEACCLEDLFGSIFGDMLNNIAFGKGNPNLVDKITKEINDDPAYIKDKLYRLAVNRELLPRSTIKLFDPKIPLKKLPNLIKSIPPDSFSEFVLNDYQPFISNIRAEGEKAFLRIIESHLWLVVDIAKKHINKALDLPLDDLIQEGSLGLMEAAKKFQPTLSARFMQYAYRRICQKINLAIANQARTIRIPVHMVETINKLLRTTRRLAQEYGHEPTNEEIASALNLTPERVEEIMDLYHHEPISLKTSIVEDQASSAPTEVASQQLLKEQINNVLDNLSEREKKVIELRFGLEDGHPRTLEEVGKLFGVTRERIRQIEATALKKLRHPSRSRKLKEYLE